MKEICLKMKTKWIVCRCLSGLLCHRRNLNFIFLWFEVVNFISEHPGQVIHIHIFFSYLFVSFTSMCYNYPHMTAGAGQKSAMFVRAQSFEDLTAETEELIQREAQLEKPIESAEELEVLVGEKSIEEQHNNEAASESRTKEEDVSSEAWRSHRKHVFVLSEAGKPIYSRYGTEEALSSTMGVMMALVSFVEAEKNIIRSIHAGQKNTS